jgi:hypothetical protein
MYPQVRQFAERPARRNTTRSRFARIRRLAAALGIGS